MEDYVLVTSASHPVLFECFESISHDCGGGAGHSNYSVPAARAGELDAAEKALSGLDRRDLQTFCIGDQDEANAIASRSPELKKVHELLEAFFNDWNT